MYDIIKSRFITKDRIGGRKKEKRMTFDIDIVGKIGSMSLVNKTYGDMDYNMIAKISRELRPGMIWVTSGATEIGRLDFIKRFGRELDSNMEDAKTDYAAQGQSILMSAYRQYVDSKYSIRQILVEHQHFNDDDKREYLKKSLIRAPAANAIPIINYNDAVSYEENRKLEILNLEKINHKAVQCVDNDETASEIANLVKPKILLILSVVDGIYNDPNDSSTLIKEIGGKNIAEVLENIEQCQTHCVGASRKGANGARAKLEFIKKNVINGTEVIIANAKYPIKDIIEGKVARTIVHCR